MKKRHVISMLLILLGIFLTGETAFASTPENGWYEENGAKYWYENGVRQGYDEGNDAYRGKEIWDPQTGAWYWLDNVQKGAVAVSKDVYQESLAGPWGDYIGADGERYGKWVRYDEEGHMIKGWSSNDDGTFYFDETYGTMAKGFATIGTKEYYFNKDTGVLEYEIGEVPEFGWKNIGGNDYWYEGFVRQGYSVDGSYRGKEIFDPVSNAWYWLDNVDGGKKAVSKDVYQESLAGEWGDYVGADGERYGKWVRYDANGHMIKGWSENENGRYYFDPIYGTMAKGEAVINGRTYHFNQGTGILESDPYKCNLSEYNIYYKYEYAYKTGDMSVLAEEDMAFYNNLAACLNEAYKYSIPVEQEIAVHDYIVLNCAYDYNNYLNGTIPSVSYTADGVFAKKTAVCDGYRKAFQLCMDILGIPCIGVVGTGNGGGHAWNAVQLDGEWYMVDVTWDDPVPDQPGRTRYDYFNVTDEELKKDHTYSCEVAATGTKYNYYVYKYGDAYADGETFVAKTKEWAASAKAGDKTQIAVKDTAGDFNAYNEKYISQLSGDSVIITQENYETIKILGVNIYIFNLTKYTTPEEYLEQALAWKKQADYGECTEMVLTTSPECLEKFTELIEQNGMLRTEQYNYEYMDEWSYASSYVKYTLGIVKAYDYKQFVAAVSEWSKTAKGNDVWEVYVPKGTYHSEDFTEKYAKVMEELEIYQPKLQSYQYSEKIICEKAFGPDAAEEVMTWLDDWCIAEKEETSERIFVAFSEENYEEEKNAMEEALREWNATDKGVSLGYSYMSAKTSGYYMYISVYDVR